MEDTSLHPVTATIVAAAYASSVCYTIYGQMPFDWRWDQLDLLLAAAIARIAAPAMWRDWRAVKHNLFVRPQALQTAAFHAEQRRKRLIREYHKK